MSLFRPSCRRRAASVKGTSQRWLHEPKKVEWQAHRRKHPNLANLATLRQGTRSRPVSLATRSCGSSALLMRYRLSPRSGGRNCAILYTPPDPARTLGPDLKLTDWPTLNL